MRESEGRQTSLFSFVQIEDRVPPAHPMRHIRAVATAVLGELGGRLDRLYARNTRPVSPPEQILRAMLLWVLYGIPSEMRLLEELEYNLLYRWFVGFGLEDPVWPRSSFRNYKVRLLESAIPGEFLARTLSQLPSRIVYHPFFDLNRSLVEEWGGQLDLDALDPG